MIWVGTCTNKLMADFVHYNNIIFVTKIIKVDLLEKICNTINLSVY